MAEEFGRIADGKIIKKETAPTSAPQAVIGSSIIIKGDLIGQEDILVEGRVEGTIELNGHSLTVGEQGVVNADIEGKNITVKGKMKGDLRSENLISINKTGHFEGNVSAPRVVLEDGARFKGKIDMDGSTSVTHKPSGQK